MNLFKLFFTTKLTTNNALRLNYFLIKTLIRYATIRTTHERSGIICNIYF